MRLLFIFLVLLNVSVGGWQLMVRYADNMHELPKPRSFARVLQPDTLTLLNEAEQIISRGDSVFESQSASQSSMSTALATTPKSDRKALTIRKAVKPARAQGLGSVPAKADPSSGRAVKGERLADSTQVAEPMARACQMLGPFKDRSMAASSLKKLFADSDVEVRVENQREKIGILHRVYIEPRRDRKSAKAVLAEMRSRDIDSYIIIKGELKNGISLGMYSNKNFADARLAKVSALGFEPKVEYVERLKDQYWLVFDAQKVSSQHYSSISSFLENRSELEIKENFCGLDIASQSNIQ